MEKDKANKSGRGRKKPWKFFSKLEYKVEKDKANKSGRGRKKPWKFFSKLDEILATRPNTQPHTVIDSSFVDAEPGVASEVEEDQESIKDHEGMSHISSINTTFYVCCIISMSYN